jgi:hypothetical protein
MDSVNRVKANQTGKGDITNEYQSIVIVGFAILAMKIFQGHVKCGDILKFVTHYNKSHGAIAINAF